ncbi:alpha-L-fucosidase [Shewanella sp. D64]|uniref:alpha-L-fucosidase n=1 Tax=unclassified Shewanella TaxID=196818 RepID=UPI0022BA6E6C|nr:MULTISPECIES: alpha-L-fucosidase [unclassified Shewanella]MEC4723964.1 alpha-L-fucosidase [Shewanella sp. D64]MEC4735984.1 alpha-L-fucosidase [Shewanella sp. E94]WBJ93053.1 alpha-L-fucosidase [Shewanella sp. MTB7]
MRKIFIVLMACWLSFFANATQKVNESMDELWGEHSVKQKNIGQKGDWFKQSKYAMFVHWGLYSIPAGQWKGKNYYGITEWLMSPRVANIDKVEYAKLADKFNPTDFDAQALVQLAVDAGMKYIVITAKHHDGFAMYDSAVSDYNIVKATPYKRDPLKALAKACKEAGIGFGLYYSQYQDWYEQGSAGIAWDDSKQIYSFDEYFERKALPQIKELMTNYGSIALIWFDTPGPMGDKYSKEIVETVKELQPNTLINSRIGNGYGDYSSLGDTHIATTNHTGLWETVDTTNNSWGYAWYDQNFKSAKKIASNLVTTIARGGNYMLNVGPTGKGVVPTTADNQLRLAGQWIAQNKEAIYGASASPWKRALPWGDVTVKDNQLYLHVIRWPETGVISLPGLENRVNSAYKLNTDEKIEFIQTNDKWIDFVLPNHSKKQLITIIKVTIDGSLDVDSKIKINHTGSDMLFAEFAACKGCEFKEVRWMEKFGEWVYAPSLVNWQDNSEASWKIDVRRKGQYYIDLEYPADEHVDYSEWMLTAGQTSLIMQAPVSEVKAGGIKLHTIKLTPITD